METSSPGLASRASSACYALWDILKPSDLCLDGELDFACILNIDKVTVQYQWPWRPREKLARPVTSRYAATISKTTNRFAMARGWKLKLWWCDNACHKLLWALADVDEHLVKQIWASFRSYIQKLWLKEPVYVVYITTSQWLRAADVAVDFLMKVRDQNQKRCGGRAGGKGGCNHSHKTRLMRSLVELIALVITDLTTFAMCLTTMTNMRR